MESNELPVHLQRLTRTGKMPNGAFSVSVQFHITPKDEIALRSEYLIEDEHVVGGDGTPDWGGESAVIQHLIRLLHQISDDKVSFGQTDIICGEMRARVPPLL